MRVSPTSHALTSDALTSSALTANALTSIFLENVRVIDPLGGIDGNYHVVLDQGRLSYFAPTSAGRPRALPADMPVCQAERYWLCPAFTDLAFHLTEPGLRHKAPLARELTAAASAGFTQVVGLPSTQPINDGPAVTGLILALSAQIARAKVLPLGALTEQLRGERLSSLRSLQLAGCVGVTQDQSPIANPVVLLNAYRYAKTFDLTVFSCPLDAYFNRVGCVHEGVMAVQLGLPAIPAAAELLAVARDIALVKATGVRLHFSGISSAQSLPLIAAAKAEGLPVTCDVAIAHLSYDETAIANFNSAFHLSPPLRTAADRAALVAALATGVVDAVSSAHHPHEPAAKLAPFAETEPGMATLDAFVPLWLALAAQGVSPQRLVQSVASAPQQVLGQKGHQLILGEQVNLTLIDPGCQWIYQADTSVSAAMNNPLLGQQLQGKVLATWCNGEEIYRNSTW